MATYTLSPKQLAAYQDNSRELLFWGGVRSGKSSVLLIKAISLASIPGSRVGICRKTLVSFKLTTLKVLLEGDGATPPILPPGSYVHNQSEKTIRLEGGGEIVYFSLEEPERIRGLTLNACIVDEATDLDEKDWITLLGRVSVKMPGMPLQLIGACNPKLPSHWLAKRFGISGNTFYPERTIKGRSAHLINPADNPYLSKEYMELLETFTGVARERDVHGKWCTVDGLVYTDFEAKKNVVAPQDNNVGNYSRYVIGVDVGFTDPFVLLVGGIDNDGKICILEEFVKTKMNEDAQADKVEELAAKYGADAIYIDYAGMGASLIDNLRNRGLAAMKATKNRNAGISRVRSKLATNTLTFSSTCTNLIHEIENYEYKEGTEEPKDGNDHCLDALRYLIMGSDKNVNDLVVLETVEIKKNPQELTAAEKKKQQLEEFERLWNDESFK